MSRLSFVVAICGLLTLSVGPTLAKAPPDTRAEAEKIASKLKFFHTGEFLVDRDDIRDLPKEIVKEYLDLIRPLSDAKYPTDAWIVLLKHKNARVRTLALAALYSREDPKLLPHIASLIGDNAATFSRPQRSFDFNPKFDPKKLIDQTVGEVAGLMVGYYRSCVSPDSLEKYLAARKDRAHCAHWYAVKFARATQATSPPGEARLERIRAVRKEIDKLPARERAWVFLWLMNDMDHSLLISEDELVAAVKELGPDRLLGMLRREADTDDPDWIYPQKKDTWLFRRPVEFVLANADKLLRPKDAQTLLRYEARERESAKKGNSSPILTAYWAIGTAQLDPNQGTKHLRDAFDRHQGRYAKDERTQLAIALWRTAGLKEQAFLIDWFYREEPGLGEGGFGRRMFAKKVPGMHTPDDRKLFAAIVRDKRFETLDWQTLDGLARVINDWSTKPVVDPESLRRAQHPFGIAHFIPMWYDKAKKEYPKQTEELFKTLANWRTALRDSAPHWEKPQDKKN